MTHPKVLLLDTEHDTLQTVSGAFLHALRREGSSASVYPHRSLYFFCYCISQQVVIPTGGGTLPSHTLHLPQLYRTGAGCDMFHLPHLKTYLYLKIENTCLSMNGNELRLCGRRGAWSQGRRSGVFRNRQHHDDCTTSCLLVVY